MNTRTLSRVGCILLLIVLGPAIALGQGVARGRPFATAHVGWTAIQALPFTASNSGGYYLSSNLSHSGAGAAITLAGENVTLDLNGFTLTGGGIGSGVETTITCVTARVMGGTIRTFAKGVHSTTGWLEADRLVLDACVDGIDIATGSVRRVVARNSTQEGVTVNLGVVRESLATGNNFWGIGVNSGLVRDCVALGNNFYGFLLLRALGVRLSASANNEEGFVATASVLRGCQSTANDIGFSLRGGSDVAECAANANASVGINLPTLDSGTVVRNCASYGGAFWLAGSRYLAVGNSAYTFAFGSTPNNVFGPIVGQPEIATSTNPHANYIH